MTPRDKPWVAVRGAVTTALAAACVAWSIAAAVAQMPPPLVPAPAAPAITALPAPPPSVVATDCGPCGKVETIRQTTAKQQWTPLGTGVGVGGVPDLGDTPAGVTSFKIGPGLSNQGMVVLGSAGGAAYKKTPNAYEPKRWEVTVKMDGGGVRVVTLSYEPYVHEGDRVRISGNNVELLD
jgi:hypothetical protein